MAKKNEITDNRVEVVANCDHLQQLKFSPNPLTKDAGLRTFCIDSIGLDVEIILSQV